MSIYNRKMFKRNARNALNQSAGVPSFQVGGPVNPGVGYSTFTSPLTRKTFRSRIPSGRGVTSLQPFDIARRYISGGRKVLVMTLRLAQVNMLRFRLTKAHIRQVKESKILQIRESAAH